MTQDDYARTDQLDDALIPLEVLRTALGVSKWTLARRLEGVERVPYRNGKAVRWADIQHVFERR